MARKNALKCNEMRNPKDFRFKIIFSQHNPITIEGEEIDIRGDVLVIWQDNVKVGIFKDFVYAYREGAGLEHSD